MMLPLFKFLERAHAKNMLEKGEVFLPPLSMFGNSKNQAQDSLIPDHTEGSALFSSRINYTGELKDASLPVANLFDSSSSPHVKIDIQNFPLDDDIPGPDVLVYCTTYLLTEESLSWARKEGRGACVMILDQTRFLDLLKEKLSEYNVYGFYPCKYDDAKVSDVSQVPEAIYWRKPAKYKRQHEIRLIAEPKEPGMVKPQTVCIPELKDILMEVDISGVDAAVVNRDKHGKREKQGKMCMGCTSKNSTKPAGSVSIPNTNKNCVLSPIVSIINGTESYGFLFTPEHHPNFQENNIEIREPIILGSVEKEKVGKIFFKTVEDTTKK